MNYFELLNTPQQFDIDDSQLRQNYFKAQQYWHPDHFSSGSEKLYASQHAALVNQAYQTLQNPLKRAQYLLSLKGYHIDDNKTISDPDILEESLQWREKLSEADDKQDVLLSIHAACNAAYKQFETLYKKAVYDDCHKILLRIIYLENLKK